MLMVFFRHGAVALLTIGAAALIIAGLVGVARLSPIEIILGAALFYLVEYAMHRFAFHAPPLRWAWLRKMQQRLHYDHHVEPSRLDLLFLPLWFLSKPVGRNEQRDPVGPKGIVRAQVVRG